jgi:rRNA-processing protein CGR1
MATVKAKEKEMKDEKEAERQVGLLLTHTKILHFSRSRAHHRVENQSLMHTQRRIQALKDKRAAKEEKARYEKLAETMHRKRVERLKRKEKRNKMLKS